MNKMFQLIGIVVVFTMLHCQFLVKWMEVIPMAMA